jgi:hypothetical protein
MNRRKNATNLGFSSLVLLAIAVVIVSSGGIVYAMMKNKQITTRSKIARIQSAMDEHNISIKMYSSKINKALDCYTLRIYLLETNSPLTDIDIKFVEVYRDPDEQSQPDDSIARR